MPYDDPSVYAKYLKGKCKDGCKDGCGCNKPTDCGCCPPGLIATYDDSGNQTGCVTPNDAALYLQEGFNCKDGFVKLFRNSTGEFLGCVPSDQYLDLYNGVNP